MALPSGKQPLFRYADEVKLDKKDRHLLTLLSRNARLPATRLAKQIGLSKDSIRYRIERLEREGLIYGYTAVVNHTALGKEWFGILCNPYFQQKEGEEEFRKILRETPEALKVIRLNGRWTYQADVVVKKPSELTLLLGKLKEHAILNDLVIYYQVREHAYTHIPPAFFREHEVAPTPAGRFDPDTERVEVDGLDEHLLKALARNGRASLVSLSKECGCSVDTVQYRLKKMERAKLLLGFMAVINTALLTDEYWLFIKTRNARKVLVGLQDLPTIGTITEIGFHHELLAWSFADSLKTLETELYTLKERFPMIEAIEILTAVREEKYTEYQGVEIEVKG